MHQNTWQAEFLSLIFCYSLCPWHHIVFIITVHCLFSQFSKNIGKDTSLWLSKQFHNPYKQRSPKFPKVGTKLRKNKEICNISFMNILLQYFSIPHQICINTAFLHNFYPVLLLYHFLCYSQVFSQISKALGKTWGFHQKLGKI